MNNINIIMQFKNLKYKYIQFNLSLNIKREFINSDNYKKICIYYVSNQAIYLMFDQDLNLLIHFAFIRKIFNFKFMLILK
jgi:hypothetical protein